MNAREAVIYLGKHGYPCSIGTLRALVKAGDLHCFRPGPTRKGPMVFTEEQVDAFLRAAVTGAAPVKVARVQRPREKKARPVRAVVVSDSWDRVRAEGGS